VRSCWRIRLKNLIIVIYIYFPRTAWPPTSKGLPDLCLLFGPLKNLIMSKICMAARQAVIQAQYLAHSFRYALLKMSALPRLIWLNTQKPNRWLFHSALLTLCPRKKFII
ncbi:hypothetical protein, partial [Eudoraea sp.]|uniref:hypothetical protein n=1 Tax=Eudoraea sp. TaxID=1979955 RepID=UPI003C70AEFE